MDVNYTKQYADACVQTSPSAYATRVNINQDAEKSTPAFNRLKRVTYNDEIMSGVYLNSPGSGRIYPRTPVNRMKPQLPCNLPSQLLSPLLASQAQRRIVSHPEDIRPNRLSEQLSNSIVATSRSVSMPAAIHHFPQIEIHYDDLPFAQMSPSFSYEEENSQLQFCRQEDMPHTPSFSSNSESIEIVDSSYNIYDNLVRVQGHPSSKGKAAHKDWITWSNSPPRPIPALHGPSSLPYARCPSGAEGTVIEEPSVVPGLIWGLRNDASNMPLDRHHPGSVKAVMQPYSGHLANESARMAPYAVTHIAREPLGEWTNRHERMSPSKHALRPHYDDMQITHSPSALENLDHAHTIPDKEAPSDPRDYHDQYRRASVDDYNQKQVFPNTVYSSILREPGCFKEGLDLSPLAPMVSSGPRQSTRQAGMINNVQEDTARISEDNIPRIDDTLSREHSDPYSTRRKHRITQNVLPTPPDSTSPLWSSESSPPLGGPILANPHIKMARVQKPASQSFGLNIHAPTASLEELSDQLRQLILQQVNYDSMISGNRDTGPIHAVPPTQEKGDHVVPLRSRTKATAIPPFKPSMPINLQDLVARQTTNHIPVIETPALVTPTLPVATQTFNDTVLHNRTISAPTHDSFPNQHPPKDDYEYRAGRGNVLTGRRHPRSIPLSRLLEKKLAPVPEETSFTNTTFETSPTIRPAQSSASTITRPAKKDYDFGELPSPVAEASAHELLSSQIESAGLEADRKAAAAGQYAKQKKRQTKAKGLAGAPKNAKAASTPKPERRGAPNDENVHLTGPSASASKKKPKTTQKAARVNESAKRNADQQKARR